MFRRGDMPLAVLAACLFVSTACIEPVSRSDIPSTDAGVEVGGETRDAREGGGTDVDPGGFDDGGFDDADFSGDVDLSSPPRRDMDAGHDATGPDLGWVKKSLTFQDGVSPEPDYSGTRDTELNSDNETSNYGDYADLEVDEDNSTLLFAWDISAIPSDAVVESASMTFVSTNNSSSGPYDVMPVNVAWDEAEATWEKPRDGVLWQQGGALGASDRGPEVFGEIEAPDPNTVMDVPSSPELVARVQSWVTDPGVNHGVTIQRLTTTDGLHIRSCEDDTPGDRPKLEVAFRVPVTSRDSR